MNTLSDMVQRAYEMEPEFLPDLHVGPTILISSDYSGEHGTASFQTLSFLFADLAACGTWMHRRKVLRTTKLPNKRRMSFKRLGDSQRNEALLPFLSAADEIPGLSVTILIDKKIQSFFTGPGPLDMSHPDLAAVQHWKPVVLEKLLRVLQFAAFFLAGLSRPGQDVLWITDDDAIAPNADRVTEVTTLFSNIASHYLDYDLRHLKFGTAITTDDGSRTIEDLVSIPDLVAGALLQTASDMRLHDMFPASRISLPLPPGMSRKTQSIMRWFADKAHPLKRVVYAIESEGQGRVTIKDIDFHVYDLRGG